MHLFYTPDIEAETYQLSEEESKHASRVLRLVEGDEVILTDGRGNWITSQIIDAHQKRCMVKVITKETNYHPKPYHLKMVVAPTKNISRFEWFLEKATEIGIDEITPLLSEHSERKEVKLKRLEKVVTSAMKQSLKAWHPQLNEMTSFSKIMEDNFEGKKFIAYCEADKEERMEKYLNPGEKAIILIGPEGGFSPEEIEQAKNNGYLPISISQSRLRTETAAITACHSVAFINKF